MFSPALIQVAGEFDVSSEAVASFAVTVYLLGFGIGSIFMGPLSERYGRLPIYHGTNVFFVAFTIGCAWSNNIAALMASRFFAGCVGCAPLILGSPTIGDFTPPEKRGPIITLFSLFALLGPVVGPIGGGFLSGAHGWGWVFGVIAIVVSFKLFCRTDSSMGFRK
jgi:multidrug resistance protein